MKRKVMSWGVLHKGRLVVWRLLGRTDEKERWVQEMSKPTKLEDMEDQVSRQEFRMQARSASLLLTWMSRRTGSEMVVRFATKKPPLIEFIPGELPRWEDSQPCPKADTGNKDPNRPQHPAVHTDHDTF